MKEFLRSRFLFSLLGAGIVFLLAFFPDYRFSICALAFFLAIYAGHLDGVDDTNREIVEIWGKR